MSNRGGFFPPRRTHPSALRQKPGGFWTSSVIATFVGGPRHGQRHTLAPDPPETIQVPSPEGTHVYRRTSLGRRPVGSTEPATASYHYDGLLQGSDEPDEVGLRLLQVVASVQAHVRERTAMSAGAVMLPEDVLPGVTRVLGLEVVRGDRVALLLELM